MSRPSVPSQGTCLRRAATRLWLACLLALCAPLVPALSVCAPSVAYATEAVDAPSDDGAYFSNTQLRSDAADPCIIKVGGTYYLFVTTPNQKIPFYSSTDLKSWKLVGNALTVSGFTGTGKSRGDIWAPEVRERTVNGKTTYVLTYTAADYWDDHYRICVAEASSLTPGAFGKPTVLDTGSIRNAIDSDLYFEGSNIWVYFKNESDYKSIWMERLGTNWSRRSDPKKVLKLDQPWETVTIEGPWLFKWGSTYYLMYSSGDYTTTNYSVGYATATSPEGPFTKMTTTAPLVRSKQGVIGPGHNTTLLVADGEIYLVYHSLHKAGEVDRRLMMDRMGIDARGRMFVNFAGWGKQPLPSGTKGYYQVPTDDYSVTARGVESVVLSDVINGHTDNVSVGTVKASSVTANVEDGYKLSDLWLYGKGSSFSGTATVVINDTYEVGGYALSGTSIKLTLPDVHEYARTVEVRMSAAQTLSEVLLVSRGERWVSVYFTDVGASTAHREDIDWMAETALSTGWVDANTGAASFKPSANIARGDMAAFLFRLAKMWNLVDDSWQPGDSGEAKSFVDVTPSTAHYREIMWLAETGISEGWETEAGRQYRPSAKIARADMAAFLYRLAVLAGKAQPFEEPTDEQPEAGEDAGQAADDVPAPGDGDGLPGAASDGVAAGEDGMTADAREDGDGVGSAAQADATDATQPETDEGTVQVAADGADSSQEAQASGELAAMSGFFLDVTANTAHCREVEWLAEVGISEGWQVKGGREFRPYTSIARGDVAAFLHRLYLLS